MISAPGYHTLITHLFFEGDEFLQSDAVFGVKPSLVVRPELKGGISTVENNFGLARELYPGSARSPSFVAANTRDRRSSRQRMTPLAPPLQSC